MTVAIPWEGMAWSQTFDFRYLEQIIPLLRYSCGQKKKCVVLTFGHLKVVLAMLQRQEVKARSLVRPLRLDREAPWLLHGTTGVVQNHFLLPHETPRLTTASSFSGHACGLLSSRHTRVIFPTPYTIRTFLVWNSAVSSTPMSFSLVVTAWLWAIIHRGLRIGASKPPEWIGRSACKPAMPKHKKEKAGPGMRHQPLAKQVLVEHFSFLKG